MKEKVQKFMIGRYGFDELSKAYMGATIVLIFLSMLFKSTILNLAAIALLVYSYYRVFSRNVEKRREEEQKYRSFRYQCILERKAFKTRQKEKKIYRFYKCPQCRQKVRVPKGRGKICITCPKCQTEFIKKS